jgi:hypothetical protein
MVPRRLPVRDEVREGGEGATEDERMEELAPVEPGEGEGGEAVEDEEEEAEAAGERADCACEVMVMLVVLCS